jgi:LacI family transcriptional regulator
VSQSTVSRVLSGTTAVNAETKARVLEAIERSGYLPNHSARAMRTRKTGMVGIVVSRLTNPFYPELIEALNAALSENGLRMILWDADLLGEEPAVEAIKGNLVDGVIFTTFVRDSPAISAALEGGEPAVLVNRPAPDVPCDQVASANEDGGRSVAGYFVEHGRDRPALIVGPDEIDTGTERERGFRLGLADLTGSDNSVRFAGEYSHESGYAGFKELMSGANPPNAIFCMNDLIAFGAVDAARDLDIRIPEDVWVVGYDNIEMSSWSAYDLTTVDQPKVAMARAAIDLLLARMDTPNRPLETRRFAPRLVMRGSTGA